MGNRCCPLSGTQFLLLFASCCASVVVARSIRWFGLGLFSDACQNRAGPKTTQSVSMLASMVALYRKQIRRSAEENHHARLCRVYDISGFSKWDRPPAPLALLSCASLLLFYCYGDAVTRLFNFHSEAWLRSDPPFLPAELSAHKLP